MRSSRISSRAVRPAQTLSADNAEIHIAAGVESSTGKTAYRRLMCNFLLSAVMVARSHHRGHRMWFDESTQEWRYDDDDTSVRDHWEKRPCGKCGESFSDDGHDPCIANLPGVRNACCGHGDEQAAYVQFEDGRHESGAAAVAVFRELSR